MHPKIYPYNKGILQALADGKITKEEAKKALNYEDRVLRYVQGEETQEQLELKEILDKADQITICRIII